jgi:predicted DNA binding CopG/RHH family protein
MKFNEEEKKLIESIEKGEWKSIANLQKEIERSKQIAKTTLRKDQRMNIRISKRDLDALRIRAIEEGIPYQTLVSRIIHKYLSGSFELNSYRAKLSTYSND